MQQPGYLRILEGHPDKKHDEYVVFGQTWINISHTF